MAMSRARILILTFLVFLIPAAGFPSPVGNIGDPAVWTQGLLKTSGELSFTASVVLDQQTNNLPILVTRFNWTNPDVTPLEERAYSQIRWSHNTMTTLGTKIGVPFGNNALLYALLGSSYSKIKLHYEDWTVSREYERNDSFSSGPDLYYGLGATIIMQRMEGYENIPLTIGMDINYRRYSTEENKIGINKTSYSSTMDEIQLAISLSANMELASPYAGVKVTSLTGKERYVNQNDATSYYPEGYVNYHNKIVWFKNIGYFVGVTRDISNMFSLGCEIRFGDEKGMGLTATTRF
jgi:hypothetical protein